MTLILYLAFYTLSLINVLRFLPLLYISIVDPTHKKGYFYLNESYLEIDAITMCMVTFLTVLEKLPYYERFGPFLVYAMIDLIISITVCTGCIRFGHYNIPFIEENINLFYVAVCISICFKITHLFLVGAIFVHNEITPLPPLPPPEGRRRVGEDVIVIPLEDSLPPPYEYPPSYTVATTTTRVGEKQ